MRQIGGIPAIVRLHSLPFALQEQQFGQMLLFVDLHLVRGQGMRVGKEVLFSSLL
jgi:hypothetical protein